MVWFILRTVSSLVVLALIGQQLLMYKSIVLEGSYMSVAPFYLQVVVGAVWPLLVLLIGFLAIRFVWRFKLSNFS